MRVVTAPVTSSTSACRGEATTRRPPRTLFDPPQRDAPRDDAIELAVARIGRSGQRRRPVPELAVKDLM